MISALYFVVLHTTGKSLTMLLHVLLLVTYPCWMSSFNFATFLSSITVEKENTKSQSNLKYCSTRTSAPYERFDHIPGVPNLTATKHSNTNKYQKQVHSDKLQPSLTSSNLLAELGIADKTIQFLRRFLQDTGVY